MKWLCLVSFLALFTALLIGGCGGGGGGGGAAPQSSTPSVIVDWPTRTRDLIGPSSALSVQIVLHSSNPQQADVVIQGNRNSTLAAHAETYTASAKALVGPYSLTATFFANGSQSGAVTATASAAVAISSPGALTNPDGTPLGAIAFSSAIQSVVVAPNQTVLVGATAQVTATALNSKSNILALSPGAFQFAITSGNANGSITPDGILTGVAAGSVSVTASVDGVTSTATAIQILPIKATPSVSVDWPTRSRNPQGPSSALSVKVVLHSPSGANPDVEIDGNRSSSLAAHTDTYSYSSQAAIGAYTLTATFYSQASLGGVVTATASANVAIAASGALTNPDGSTLSAIGFSTDVKSVVIAAGQSVVVGHSAQLTVTAYDAGSNILALTP